MLDAARANSMGKLGLSTTIELVRYDARQGWWIWSPEVQARAFRDWRAAPPEYLT